MLPTFDLDGLLLPGSLTSRSNQVTSEYTISFIEIVQGVHVTISNRTNVRMTGRTAPKCNTFADTIGWQIHKKRAL